MRIFEQSVEKFLGAASPPPGRGTSPPRRRHSSASGASQREVKRAGSIRVENAVGGKSKIPQADRRSSRVLNRSPTSPHD